MDPQNHVGRCGKAPQRPSCQLADKRKANELASSGESFEPANRCLAPSDGTAPLPVSAWTVTGEQAAACGQQLGRPRGRGVVRACSGWARHPVSAKWVAEAHSYVFGIVITRCLIRDSQQTRD
jgi:hypothetical protein